MKHFYIHFRFQSTEQGLLPKSKKIKTILGRPAMQTLFSGAEETQGHLQFCGGAECETRVGEMEGLSIVLDKSESKDYYCLYIKRRKVQ